MNLHNNGANQNVPSAGSHNKFSPDKPSNQSSSYISSATSAIADRAISAKNAVASKLGYGATQPAEHHDYSRGYVTGATKSGSSPREHQNKVLDPSANQLKPSEAPQVRRTIQPDRNAEHDLQKSNQSGGTYTEKLSSATSAIADKAISAKNVVASKLGYGASDHQENHDNLGNNRATNVLPGSAASDLHGKTMTSTVTEKLAPVYEKVAGVGSAVMSKFQGGNNATGAREANADQAVVQDKGVSVKDYFVEKLKPGEEDRVLSEVIREKLQIHKPTTGNVTESEQVRQSLGNKKNENYVVERVKASVGSMLGGADKNDEGQQGGLSSSAAGSGEDDNRRSVCVVEHRTLQEN